MAERNPVTLDAVLAALRGLGCNPKPSGKGWQAKCPAHEDKTPSLSVSQGRDHVLIKCFAGCSFRDISAALNLGTPLRVYSGGKDATAQALPSGPNITVDQYHDADGRVLFAVVRRDSPTGKRISQWTPAGGGLWVPKGFKGQRPLWNLKAVLASTGRVIIVEGEKCARAATKAWPKQACTTWAGGTETWNLTDWKALKGRAVSILADADDQGRKAAKGIANKLLLLGCDVKIALPEGGDGFDIVDWIAAAGPREVAERVKGLLRPYDPLEPGNDAGGPTTASHEALIRNQHYRILGLAGDQVAIRISAGRVLLRSPESLCSPQTLIAIAPATWWHAIAGIESLSRREALAIGDGMIREAYRLGAVDVSSIFGRGAVRVEEGQKIIWHLGDRLLKDGKEVSLDEPSQIWLAEPRIEMACRATQGEIDAVREAVLGYRWHAPADAQRFLGWIAAAVAGGALEWRPHLILAGPAGTGKSWLLREVLQRLLGPLLVRIADGTPASIARLTADSSLPLALDEAEPSSAWIMNILQLLRIASGGDGQRLRADQGGKGVTSQSPRFSALISTTAVPTMTAADASRISLIRLGRPVADWPEVAAKIKKTLSAAPNLRARLISDTPAIAKRASEVTELLQVGEGKISSRDALMAGALTAGWWWWTGPEGEGKGHVLPHSTRPDVEDATEALFTILALKVKDNRGVELPIVDVLQTSEGARIGSLFGVRIDTDGLLVAPYHAGLQAALSRSLLARTDLRRLLLQTDGSSWTNPRYFGGIRRRAVLYPTIVLQRMGIELTDQL